MASSQTKIKIRETLFVFKNVVISEDTNRHLSAKSIIIIMLNDLQLIFVNNIFARLNNLGC